MATWVTRRTPAVRGPSSPCSLRRSTGPPTAADARAAPAPLPRWLAEGLRKCALARLPPASPQALAQLLAAGGTLAELNLCDNCVGFAGAQALAAAVRGQARSAAALSNPQADSNRPPEMRIVLLGSESSS